MKPKMTMAAARAKFRSNYRIAQILKVHRCTVGRWGRYVPDKHVPMLQEAK